MIKKTLIAFLTAIATFAITYIGSIEIPGRLLPILFGPISPENPPTLFRMVVDLFISVGFTAFAAFLGARLSKFAHVLNGMLGPMLYFSLIVYLTIISQSLEPWPGWYVIVTPIKVPIAAAIGVYIGIKSNNSFKKAPAGRDVPYRHAP